MIRSGLLWNTFRGDLEWFRASARSYSKFARGFSLAKCVVPGPDFDLFLPICRENNIVLSTFDEWPEAGFNHHQAMQCMADILFPPEMADVIFHIDADCVFGSECSPEDWLPGGKILLLFTDYEKFLTAPVQPNERINFMGFSGLRSDFNRGQYWWKFAVDTALGFPAERECMGWMPLAHWRDVYRKTRQVIEEHHRVSFEGYVRGCRNTFPQSFCEFNTLGAIAHKFFREDYCWWNTPLQGYPFAGKVVQAHSHGGFDLPHPFPGELGGVQTPRELHRRLGVGD